MWEMRKEGKFEAGHHIPGHIDHKTGEPGKCSRPHGHSYRVALVLTFYKVFPVGFAVDFGVVGDALKEVTDYLDHQYLNYLPEFQNTPPTAENIALLLFETVKKKLFFEPWAETGLLLQYAECSETVGAWVRYYPDILPEYIP